MRRCALLGLVLFAACQQVACAEEPAKPKVPSFSFRVSVDVSAQGSLKDLITSYVTRELRDISDVIVVESDPQFSIEIVALDSGPNAGYAVSVVYLQYLRADGVALAAGATAARPSEGLRTLLVGAAWMRSHELRTCPPGGLRTECEKIVAGLDSQQLERIRKLIQEVNDMVDHNEKHVTPAATK